MKKAFRWTLQLLGVLVVGTSILAGVVAWRLTSGPVSISFLTPYFENALTSGDGTFLIDVDDTILTWVGDDQTVDLQLKGARVLTKDGKLVAAIPDLSVSLSASALLKQKIAPESLSIKKPSLTIVRKFDGTFDVDAKIRSKTGADFTQRLFSELYSPPGDQRPLSYLTRIDILDAALTIDDRLLGVVWQAPKADITLNRNEAGLSGWANLDLAIGKKISKVTIAGQLSPTDRDVSLSITFADVFPRDISKLSEKLTPLAHFALPVNGFADVTMSREGVIEKMEFRVSGRRGKIHVPHETPFDVNVQSVDLEGKFDRPRAQWIISSLGVDFGKNGKLGLPAPVNHVFPIRELKAAGSYAVDAGRIDVVDLVADLGGPTAKLDATIQEIAGQLSFELSGEVRGVTRSKMPEVWPANWGALARSWVVDNITGGGVPVARAKASGRWTKGLGAELDSLIGDMVLKDMSAIYLAPMPQATHGNGRAKFDMKTFEIFIDEAEVAGLAVSQGKLLFTGLDEVDQYADIDVDVQGELGAALKLIDSEPLKFAQAVNFSPEDVTGKGISKIKLRFIVERTLTKDQVDVSIASDLEGVSVKNLALNMDIENGDLSLTADNNKMDVTGDILLGGIKAKLSWRENFDESTKNLRRYNVSAKLNDSQWRKLLDIDAPPFTPEYLSGDVGAELRVDFDRAQGAKVSAKLNLSDLNMSLPEFEWTKSPKVEAFATLNADMEAGKIRRLNEIRVDGGGLTVVASADFGQDGKLSGLNFDKLSFGSTDLTGSVSPTNAGWRVAAKGARLDLVPWLSQEEEPAADTEAAQGPTIDVRLDVDRVQLYPGKHLSNVRGRLSRTDAVWTDVDILSRLPNGRSLVIKMQPKDGKRVLNVASNDAGEALRTLDLYDDVVGGQLALKGEFEDNTPDAKLVGHVAVENFRLIDAPVLARLLSIASLAGIPDGLTGTGLSFQRLDAPFTKENGVILISDAKAGGLNLGITASGSLDTHTKLVDIKGSVAPLDKINSVLGTIPIFGIFFSGGEKGGGVFAAEYTMKGDAKDPQITANPLTALTPGIFRKIFGIFDLEEGGDKAADRPKPEPLE